MIKGFNTQSSWKDCQLWI